MDDGPESTATVLELSKIPEQTYEWVSSPLSPVPRLTHNLSLYIFRTPIETTGNEAYNVFRQTRRTASTSEYEVPNPPTSSSSQPLPTAAASPPGDTNVYEHVQM